MKKGKKFYLIALLALLMLAIPTQASAAVKISKKSVTLIKGQTVTLKISGTKSKVSWSSNKKSVATVSSNGKVTAKKKGSATITAKVAKKKYTCKVKVETPSISNTSLNIKKGFSQTLKVNGTSQKVNWKSDNKTIATVTSKGAVKGVKEGKCKITATVGEKKYSCTVTVSDVDEGKAQYKSYRIDDEVVVIVKNGYNYTARVELDCLFYNSGVLVGKGSDYEYALEAGNECALHTFHYGGEFDDYKINIKIEKAQNIISNVKNISLTSNYGNDNVMVQVTNNGQRVMSTLISILFYKNGQVIGYDYTYADVNNVGDVDFLEFTFPYKIGIGVITPDNYKLYVNSSYRYTWN